MTDEPSNVTSISPRNRQRVSSSLKSNDSSKIEKGIKNAGLDSRNVFFNVYVDDVLRELDFTHLQILKLIREGSFTEIRAERGRAGSFGFTIAFKFGGEIEACHIRGWYDQKSDQISIADMFMNAKLTV